MQLQLSAEFVGHGRINYCWAEVSKLYRKFFNSSNTILSPFDVSSVTVEQEKLYSVLHQWNPIIMLHRNSRHAVYCLADLRWIRLERAISLSFLCHWWHSTEVLATRFLACLLHPFSSNYSVLFMVLIPLLSKDRENHLSCLECSSVLYLRFFPAF